jgi:hypothetical protein
LLGPARLRTLRGSCRGTTYREIRLHLIQLADAHGRRAGRVEGGTIRLLDSHSSIYSLAIEAIESGAPIAAVVERHASGNTLPYDPIYRGHSEWRILPSFDHPEEPARCLVSGTGLTHKASAENRAAMHQKAAAAITDSMRMYQLGLEGGTPPAGEIGVQPEWFYKGDGSILKAHGETLTVPPFANDGGEEPEIAGVYVIGPDRQPYRVGLTVGNEFSDHKMEKQNYLYLAPSKLRNCSIGPELVAGEYAFDHVAGTVSVQRHAEVLWHKDIFSGEKNMSHSLANLEYHHFKYDQHRRPGDVHIHFFGADAFSFGDGIVLQSGDVTEVAFDGFGKPLRNTVEIAAEPEHFLAVKRL